MKYWYLAMVCNPLFINVATAHDGIAHHAETHNELEHFAAHTLMALPVVIAVWLVVWGAKRFIAKRAVLRKRG